MTSTSTSTPRIGFLYPGYRDPEFDAWRLAFLKALEDVSWIEGGNLLIEWRFAEYDRTRYAPLADELVRGGVVALATAGTPLTHALRRVTESIPIVTGVGDPVGSGFAISLQNPGLNITGLSWGLREKARKQIGLLVEMVPTVQTFLVLRSRRYGDIPELNTCLKEVAKEFGRVADIRTAESFAEIESALGSVAGTATGAAIIYGHGAFQFDPSKLASAAIRHGVVTIGDERRAAEAGCLMSYAMRHPDQERRFASIIDRVLRGDKPAQIPFELPAESELIVNRATATALGLVLSKELLHRADAVIG